MLFNSLEFLFAFFPLFLISYFSFKARTIKNFIILAFSLFFYSWGEPVNIVLMLLMIFLSYFSALLIDHLQYKRLILIAYIILALSLLGYFKYFDFFVYSVNSIFNLNIALKNIALPIGISFYTFQCMSYVFDVYMKQCKSQKNLINFACYVSLFPQLIAGPIVRYTTIAEELSSRKESFDQFLHGFRRFVIGLAKKVLLANNIAIVADTIFNSNIHIIPVNVAWIGAVAYSLQIYFDFSGYSDMAIGIGKMLGFHFLENFNFPYLSRSATEFWRRWHISLGTWFRDYIYIPLGGNRVSFHRWIINIFVVWGLTGLWHGASWNFVLWGLYYAIVLIFEKIILSSWLKKHSVLSHFYALLVIIIGWILFRAETISDCFYYLVAMVDFRYPGNFASLIKYGIIENLHFLILGVVFCFPLSQNKLVQKLKSCNILVDLVLFLLLLICIVFIVNESYSPFIYFRF